MPIEKEMLILGAIGIAAIIGVWLLIKWLLNFLKEFFAAIGLYIIYGIFYPLWNKNYISYRLSGKGSFKGRQGERRVASILRRLGPDYKVINDLFVKLDANKDIGCQVDHLVISKYGIFVLETKNKSGFIIGSADDKNWYSETLTKEGVNKEIIKMAAIFHNPLKQNASHVNTLTKILDDNVKGAFVPALVFGNECEIIAPSSTTAILHFSQLKNFIYGFKEEKLDEETVVQIYKKLKSLNITSKSERAAHVAAIKRKIQREAEEDEYLYI